MGFEKLRESLITRADADAAKIIADAELKASELSVSEKSTATAISDIAASEAKTSLDLKSKERLAWARLEAKRILSEAREDAVSNSFDLFVEELTNLKKSAEYKSFIRTSVDRALTHAGSGAIIHVLKGEKDLVPKSKEITISEDLSGFGGVIVESADGTVFLDLTLETLIEMRRDDLRKEISAKLFG